MKYYNVPDFPGVPPVLRDPQAAAQSFITGKVASLVSPAVGRVVDLVGSVTGTLNNLLGPGDDLGEDFSPAGPGWGLFDSEGNLAVNPTSFLGFEFRNSRRISNYPLEQGAFESYNKVNDPFDIVVGMACGGGAAERADFLATIKALADDLNLYTLATPDELFESVNVARYDYARKQHNGATLITVNLYLQEIRINTKSEYTSSVETPVTVEEAAAATTPETVNASATTKNLEAEDVLNPASASPQSQGQVQAAPATADQAAPAPGSANSPPPPPYVPGSSGAGDVPTTAPALTKLPEGYSQDRDTGNIRGPDGKVDRQLSINQGSSFIG